MLSTKCMCKDTGLDSKLKLDILVTLLNHLDIIAVPFSHLSFFHLTSILTWTHVQAVNFFVFRVKKSCSL